MSGKNTLITMVLVFIAIESLIYYFCYGNSGGDLVFQIFSSIFLVFYGIILLSVSKTWGISKNLAAIALTISAIVLFIVIKFF
jgi:hypothetical protein